MCGCRATAAADNVYTKVAREVCQVRSEGFGSLFVMSMTADVLWNAGVRDNRVRQGGVLTEVANVFAHLLGAGCAVHPDYIDGKGLERGKRGADFSSHQHGAK